MTRKAVLTLALMTLVVPALAQSRRRPPRPQPGAALTVHLSEAPAPAEVAGPRPVPAPATPLADADRQKVLDRLPPLKATPEDATDFAKREDSLPPPKTGRTIDAPFPAPESPTRPDVAEGPVEVLRRAPEGEVPLAPHLSITFSKPMVALASHGELAREVPVKLTPEPKGSWRWLGTKTLVFQPEPRFPMATQYRVEIPAGTKAASGGQLEKSEEWTFSTPPPKVVWWQPASGPQPPEPLLAVGFDQAIAPAEVLKTITVRDERGTDYELRPATPEENATIRRPAGESGGWLAFKATRPFPADTSITVTVGAGTPSAEGPRKTETPQATTIRTYGALRVTDQYPRKGEEGYPGTSFHVSFSNPLEAVEDAASLVKISPELEGAKVWLSGSSLGIQGETRAKTTYEVTISGALRDIFGGTLREDAKLAFKIGPAPKHLQGRNGLVVLDPAGGTHLSVYSSSYGRLRVRAHRVRPTDWRAYTEVMRNAWRDREALPALPGEKAFEEEVEVAGEGLQETRIDLKRALAGGLGHVLVAVEPTEKPARGRPPFVVAWVQATRIGLDAFVDHENVLGWATALADGKPLEGVELTIEPGAGPAVASEASGLATLPLAGRTDRGSALLVAKKGEDVAFLPEHPTWWTEHSSWQPWPQKETLRWYVADDRHLYRPGETARLKVWLRRFGVGKTADLLPLGEATKTLKFRLLDSRGNEVTKGERTLNALGGCDLALELPKTMNLGWAHIELETQGDVANTRHGHNIQLQEFRRPEFEVGTQASEGPHFVGGEAVVTASASYYAGGALQAAEVTWDVSTSSGHFTPPNPKGFSFGTWVPWWAEYHGGGAGGSYSRFAGRTDASGKHRLAVHFDRMGRPRPATVRVQATVRDVNRQAWTSATTLLVHPASVYVGLKTARPFVEKGKPIELDVVVVDLDGKPVEDRGVDVKIARLDWKYENGSYVEVEADTAEKRVASGLEPARISYTPDQGGTYRITATVKDGSGRPNETELSIWVAGGKTIPSRGVAQEKVTLVPDRNEYQPGDTAELLVVAPFAPAEGIVTVRRNGIVRAERFSMKEGTHTLKVKVEDGQFPQLAVQVDLVGTAEREGLKGAKLPRRPAFATGQVRLPVPPNPRRLVVSAKPRDLALEPGGETQVEVEVRDARERPVAGAEVVLVVVDEAVLALSGGYRLPDPVGVFYQAVDPGVRDHHLRSVVELEDPALLKEAQRAKNGADAPAGGARPAAPARRAMADEADAEKKDKGGVGGGGESPIAVRTVFDALATFAPEVPTDASGKATVKVKLPDSLTRYRVMAIVASGAREFGSSEATITARLPLMVRPSAPRFLNFGDRFELPVVVQNQTDAPLTVDLAARAANAEVTEGGRRVTVPANDRVEVRFPAAAARAGTARFQVGAVSGRFADAAEVSLPVWTPATAEAFATYGELDEGALIQPVRAPKDAFPQFGGLEVTTSSTALQELTDAYLYLVSYPFECSEQLSSRILAVAALRDVLTAFQASGLPSSDEVVAAVQRDVKRLRGLQNPDGGFAFWRRGDESWPYVSIHAAHALARAREKDFDVPPAVLETSKRYLREVERHFPHYYGPEVRRTLSAYALNVRLRLGDRDAKKARKLMDEHGLEKLSLEAVGWLLPVLSGDESSTEEVAAIRRHLAARATETAGTAHFATSYTDGAHLLLHSERRADAIVLEALIADSPKSDLIPKIVRGLLAHRTAGRWANTQENAFVLLALDRYFQTFEKATPDFVARAWLGKSYAGEHAFKGRTTDRKRTSVPLRGLLEGEATKDLVLAKEGPGRLYYRIGLRYAPASLKLDPLERGFTVTRSYEGVDDPADVRRDESGTWHVKAGARVRVRLSMVAPTRRYHVALVDPLAAGLEPVNPALATTGALPADTAKRERFWWWSRTWFEHQNLRDERVEAFTSLLWEGVHAYTYIARATTPGTFVVPPAKAEEMYAPETFGRSGSDKVVVE